jgi:hypothetical protein
MLPKIIHNIVGPSKNELVEECLASWESTLKYGFGIKHWDDHEIEKFISKWHPLVLPAFKNARNHAEAADIARYLIVYNFGGVYADWDVEVLHTRKIIKIFSNHPNGFMLLDPLNNTLHPEFFCANVNDPFLLNLVEDIVSLYNNNERNALTTPAYSGPFRMRDSLALHPETNMDIINVKEIFAYDYKEIQNPIERVITQPLIHYWMHSWVNV